MRLELLLRDVDEDRGEDLGIGVTAVSIVTGEMAINRGRPSPPSPSVEE